LLGVISSKLTMMPARRPEVCEVVQVKATIEWVLFCFCLLLQYLIQNCAQFFGANILSCDV